MRGTRPPHRITREVSGPGAPRCSSRRYNGRLAASRVRLRTVNHMIEPGWYDDPSEPTRLRWWDGAGWTEHIRARQLEVAPDIAEIFASPGAALPSETSPFAVPPAVEREEASARGSERTGGFPWQPRQPGDGAGAMGASVTFDSVGEAVSNRAIIGHRTGDQSAYQDAPPEPRRPNAAPARTPRHRRRMVFIAAAFLVAIGGGQAIVNSGTDATPPAAPQVPSGTPSNTDPAVPVDPATALTGADRASEPDPTTPTGTTGGNPDQPDVVSSVWGPSRGLFIAWIAPLDGPQPELYEVTVRAGSFKKMAKTAKTDAAFPTLRITRDCTVEVVSIIGDRRSTVTAQRCGV